MFKSPFPLAKLHGELTNQGSEVEALAPKLYRLKVLVQGAEADVEGLRPALLS